MSIYQTKVTTTRKEIVKAEPEPCDAEKSFRSTREMTDNEIQVLGKAYREQGVLDNLSDETLKEILLSAVDYYTDKLQDIYGTNVACLESYDIKFNIRGMGTGGRACTWGYWIKFNLDWARSDLQLYITAVVSHEVAHIVADRLIDGNAGHGAMWVEVMRSIGCKPNRVQVRGFDDVKPARKLTRYHYKVQGCDCEYKLTATHHKRIQARTISGYRCRPHRNPFNRDDFVEVVQLG